MTNYEAIGIVVIGLGALIVLAKPLMDLRGVLVRLEETLKSLEKIMSINQERNDKDHNIIFDQLRDHEKRISQIENEAE